MKKEDFHEKKNDLLDMEPFVTCVDCGRKLHQVCVLHNENIWRNGYKEIFLSSPKVAAIYKVNVSCFDILAQS